MPQCPKCRKVFSTLEGEENDHPCPRCHYFPFINPCFKEKEQEEGGEEKDEND